MSLDDRTLARKPPPAPGFSVSAIEGVLDAVLAARRSGGLTELLRQRPLATRWLSRRYLRPVFGTAGDLMLGDTRREEAIDAFMNWSLSLLRPDGAALDADIDRQDWLARTSWRPCLALLCHYGYLPVPVFPDRYRRHAQESVADNLCGLWAVGPSTFYRYLDKARRTLACQLAPPLSADAKLALRRTLARALAARLKARDIADTRAWHLKQARHASMTRDPCSALWHHHCAADATGFIAALQRFRIELAGDSESDLLIETFAGAELPPHELFDLRLAQAAVLRSRGAESRASQVYEQALRIATARANRWMLGKVYGALGKFHESRDTDKALACFADSADFLRRACEVPGADDGASQGDVIDDYAAALQRLAWVHVGRNDPRSRAVLETANELRRLHAIRDETAALLDQTWGEYWRRTGDWAQAIEFQHRVLNVFERLGDTRQILSTYNNLSLIYIEAKDFERAVEYGNKVAAVAERSPVDAYVTASALLNLGVAWFWLGAYSRAIRHYEAGLEQALRANLPVIANRARYNLAEAHYKRYQVEHDPADEAAGDRHIAQVLQADSSERDTWSVAAAPRLKTDVLGKVDGMIHERLLPEEAAAHGAEMAAIHRHRDVLAIPGDARAHVGAHLAIANAYLAISTKEREEALALIRKHDLGDEFNAQIDALQVTFSRELTRERALAAQWKQKSYGMLGEERATTVLQQVLQSGSINKSGYADLCRVGLATASKHLGTLVDRGLLVQLGKGPSTRYVLP